MIQRKINCTTLKKYLLFWATLQWHFDNQLIWSKKLSMGFSLMSISIAGIIVGIAASISAMIGPGLQMHVHSVLFKCSPIEESFATVLTLVLLLTIWHMSCHRMELHISHQDTTFWTGLFRLVSFINMRKKSESVGKKFSTNFTCSNFQSTVIIVHVIVYVLNWFPTLSTQLNFLVTGFGFWF